MGDGVSGRRIFPATMEGQLITVFAVSFILMFGSIVAVELARRESPIDVAMSDRTSVRLNTIKPAVDGLAPENAALEAQKLSSCHFGYTVTARPALLEGGQGDVADVSRYLESALGLVEGDVVAGFREVTRDDFAFSMCADGEIRLPAQTLLLAVRLQNGAWLNAEVHPHEWHYDELASLWSGYAAIFLLVGGLAIFFVRRIGAPIRNLTNSMQEFGRGLEVDDLPETGPPDVAKAMQSFNQMQRRVRTDMEHRLKTLASISHDLRSPLTSLRLKAELVTNNDTRDSLVRSVTKMEQITASALDLLRADIRTEATETFDLAGLVSNECDDMQRDDLIADYDGPDKLEFEGRPGLIVRALRNLVDNANQHASGASVKLATVADTVEIRVSDNGPGIPEHELEKALVPFERLTKERSPGKGGFGLGLSIVESVAQAHGGSLLLRSNPREGLTAIISLPRRASRSIEEY